MTEWLRNSWDLTALPLHISVGPPSVSVQRKREGSPLQGANAYVAGTNLWLLLFFKIKWCRLQMMHKIFTDLFFKPFEYFYGIAFALTTVLLFAFPGVSFRISVKQLRSIRKRMKKNNMWNFVSWNDSHSQPVECAETATGWFGLYVVTHAGVWKVAKIAAELLITPSLTGCVSIPWKLKPNLEESDSFLV